MVPTANPSRVAHASPCMYAPHFWHRHWDTLQGGDPAGAGSPAPRGSRFGFWLRRIGSVERRHLVPLQAGLAVGTCVGRLARVTFRYDRGSDQSSH
jgi:hypothetical protein